ncbi:hypothetical protein ACFWAN_32675 [Streptomyces mirabilis]|uniref:hypothetical protein n=1 Tax=Streptomyces mirabilis TaxID=68239 RepID=UPI003653FFA3
MPLENRRAHTNVLNFIGDSQPDEVINIGDLTDYTAPARWSAGRRAEFGMSVKEEAAYTRRAHLDLFRAKYDGPYTLLGSNHGERPRKYLVDRAPALGTEDEYNEDRLLQLDTYGVRYESLKYDFAAGWTATHGHARGISMSRVAGGTAMNAARMFQRSVVMGHTHRAGIVSETKGMGASKMLTGVEVGHLMDLNKAEYLGRARFANWQSAFGLFYVEGSNVQPHVISVNRDGSFIVEGERFGKVVRGVGGRFVKKGDTT